MARANSMRSVTVSRGFRAAGTTCGLKPSGDPDLALIVSDVPCAAAGVLTRSRFPGEPVKVARRHLRGGDIRAIVCNSGISNVATGKQGQSDALAMAGQVADLIGCPRRQVLPSSTGIIGHHLPMDNIGRGIATAVSKLGRGPAADADAARAILTTDLVPKAATREVRFSRRSANVAGIAKGSGMIAPNMATMLVFITSDVAISREALRPALRRAADQSFNRISIDHDTSTSDSVFILANGSAGNAPIKGPGRSFNVFCEALCDLCRDLAYQIVKDGEGATKVFCVHVKRARSERDADRVGKAVVGSPLVKTAVHGADPNWGRLIMAVGRSGATIKPEKLALYIGGVQVCQDGQASVLNPAANRKLFRAMKGNEVIFTIDLGIGNAEAEWLGCDLSRQYIAINADYTT